MTTQVLQIGTEKRRGRNGTAENNVPPRRHIIETRGYDMFDTMFLIKLFCRRRRRRCFTFMSCLGPGLIGSRVSSQFQVTHLGGSLVVDVLYILHGITTVLGTTAEDNAKFLIPPGHLSTPPLPPPCVDRAIRRFDLERKNDIEW